MKITEVCGFKDDQGKFWDTKELAELSNRTIEIQMKKDKIRKIKDNFLEDLLLQFSMSEREYYDRVSHFPGNVTYNLIPITVANEPRYINRDSCSKLEEVFSYIARNSLLFLQLREAYREAGEIIESELSPDMQQALSDIIAPKAKNKSWWKLW